jgi:hypothetical protein
VQTANIVPAKPVGWHALPCCHTFCRTLLLYTFCRTLLLYTFCRTLLLLRLVVRCCYTPFVVSCCYTLCRTLLLYTFCRTLLLYTPFAVPCCCYALSYVVAIRLLSYLVAIHLLPYLVAIHLLSYLVATPFVVPCCYTHLLSYLVAATPCRTLLLYAFCRTLLLCLLPWHTCPTLTCCLAASGIGRVVFSAFRNGRHTTLDISFSVIVWAICMGIT